MLLSSSLSGILLSLVLLLRVDVGGRLELELVVGAGLTWLEPDTPNADGAEGTEGPEVVSSSLPPPEGPIPGETEVTLAVSDLVPGYALAKLTCRPSLIFTWVV